MIVNTVVVLNTVELEILCLEPDEQFGCQLAGQKVSIALEDMVLDHTKVAFDEVVCQPIEFGVELVGKPDHALLEHHS